MPLRLAPHPALSPVPELAADLPPEAEVFQIRFTGEVFGAYEYVVCVWVSMEWRRSISKEAAHPILQYCYRDYLARLLLYKKRHWVCEVTGKGSLTFEEALVSETKARQESMDIFPLPGRFEILSLIHYSRLSIHR
jgi:hypothetical protein